jgi:hypothetical protein
LSIVERIHDGGLAAPLSSAKMLPGTTSKSTPRSNAALRRLLQGVTDRWRLVGCQLDI